MKRRTATRHLLMQTLLVQWFTTLWIMAQPLPEQWWQKISAESILAKAESITHDLSYFRGTKAHRLNEPGTSIDFFQRKVPGGFVETKSVIRQGRMMHINYELQSGRYTFVNDSVLIRKEFTNHAKELELSLAAKLEHPYDYRLLKPAIIGNNDCIVVARIASPQYLQMLKAGLYPGYVKGKGILGDPINYLRAETDTYIRKTDGVIIGEIKKNNAGVLLDDYLYDVVHVNISIPSHTFDLPKAKVKTATNQVQFLRMVVEGAKSENSITSMRVKVFRRVIIGAMLISSVALLALLIFRYCNGRLTSKWGSK